MEEKVELYNYEEQLNEFVNVVIPQIFKGDLLPGYTRASLIQIDKHIKKMVLPKEGDKSALLVAAYGIFLGELLVRTIEGAEWMYEAPDIQLVRVKLPVSDDEESVYALPITRTFNYFISKNVDKSILAYYDKLSLDAGKARNSLLL